MTALSDYGSTCIEVRKYPSGTFEIPMSGEPEDWGATLADLGFDEDSHRAIMGDITGLGSWRYAFAIATGDDDSWRYFFVR